MPISMGVEPTQAPTEIRGDYPENERETQDRLRQLQGLDKSDPSYRRLIDEVIELNRHVVDDYVWKFIRGTHDVNRPDYQAAGLRGLWDACQTYEAEKGSPFHEWARTFHVRPAVLKAVNRTEFSFLSQRQFQLRQHVKAVEKVLGVAGDTPDDEDIAEATGATVRQVRELREAEQAQPALVAEAGEGARTLGPDQLTPEEALLANFEREEADEVLTEVVRRSDRSHLVAYILIRKLGWDGEPKSDFRKIGRELGVSRNMVQQIHKKAMVLLRDVIEERLAP